MRVKLKYAIAVIMPIIIIATTITIIVSINKKGNGDYLLPQSIISIEQKIEEAEWHYDIEILKEKMPWLDFYSAKWKQILLSDFVDSDVPGPTDFLTIGLLTLDSVYLNKIKDEYQWYEDARTIPESMVTDEMKGYVLRSSQGYKESYLSFLRGYNVSILIDFEKEIVFFSY